MSRHPAYDKVYDVMEAFTRLGPGLHSPSQVAKVCRELVAERSTGEEEVASISPASVLRVLQTGHRRGFFDKSHGRYGLLENALPGAAGSALSQLPEKATGPLAHECRVLQRTTHQVVTVHVVSLVPPHSRLLRHYELGLRPEVEQCMAENPLVWAAMREAPLVGPAEDAAGLVIHAHLRTPRSHRMRLIRSEGFASSDSPLPGRQTLAAPLWYGTHVVGALSLHAHPGLMGRRYHSWLGQLMASAARISGHCDYAATRAAA